MITLKYSCNLDVLATRRFALLVKCLQWNRKIQYGILVTECSLYSRNLSQPSSLFGVETAFPHLFFSTIFLCNSDPTTFAWARFGISQSGHPLSQKLCCTYYVLLLL